ncbi:MAG: type II toxin-antitoxin system VapC family toxin [Clostridia bacterium]|nr:type II toxin-antitoxin system VapC family toxin [Clostridia bacterium]
MRNYVLDSYAVLAYFQDEPGAEEVEKLLSEATSGETALFLSAVNLGEMAYITQRKAGTEKRDLLLAAIEALPIQVVSADRTLALQAAEFKAGYPIAFADCFALALARTVGATVVTGDPEFKKVEASVSISWLPTD